MYNLRLEETLTRKHTLSFVLLLHHKKAVEKVWLLFLPTSLHSELDTVGVKFFFSSQALSESYIEAVKVLVAHNLFVSLGLVIPRLTLQTIPRPFVSECRVGRFWDIQIRISTAFLRRMNVGETARCFLNAGLHLFSLYTRK